jgi:hypothetical protein
MKKLLNQKGSVGPLVTIFFIVLAVYLGYKFATPYYKMYTYKIDVLSIANLNISQEEMKKRFYQTGLDYKIPLESDDVKVIKDPETSRVTIEINWTEEVVLFGKPVSELELAIDVSK